MRNHEKPRQGRQNGLQREFPYAASRLRLLLPQPTADAAGFLLQLLRSYLPPLSKTDLARRRFIGRKWFDNAAAFLLTTHGTPEFYARTTLAAHHPRRARAVGTVVSTARTRARECVLESVPATGRGGVRSVDGLAARPMGLANDADRGGHPALSLAAPLAFVHQRPPAPGKMDFRPGARPSRNHAPRRNHS